MPFFAATDLQRLTRETFQATGFSAEDAETIARLMIAANLRGHDSHGFRNLGVYLKRIADGDIVPGAPVTLVSETATTAILDGHRTLGYVAADKAVALAIAKARKTAISAVGVRHVDHVGRIGAYPEMVAEQGLIGLAFVNAQGWGRLVTPFGGVQRRLGTNPVAAGFPNPAGPPILLDMATSAVAANKVRLANERSQPTGENWIVDQHGQPTQDPQEFMNGLGMLLPLGGAHGYKGYALAVMVDILAGVLAGSGTAASSNTNLDNGTFLIVIDPEAFVGREAYDRQVKNLAEYLRATPRLPGVQRILMPGEFEARHRAEREKNGIQIETGVWESITGQVTAHGVALPAPLPETPPEPAP